MAYGLQSAKTRQKLRTEELQVTVIERRKQIEIEEQEIMRKEKELTATVKLPAEAESYQVELIAHGHRYTTNKQVTPRRSTGQRREMVFFLPSLRML